jgi:hypothetical protein
MEGELLMVRGGCILDSTLGRKVTLRSFFSNFRPPGPFLRLCIFRLCIEREAFMFFEQRKYIGPSLLDDSGEAGTFLTTCGIQDGSLLLLFAVVAYLHGGGIFFTLFSVIGRPSALSN